MASFAASCTENRQKPQKNLQKITGFGGRGIEIAVFPRLQNGIQDAKFHVNRLRSGPTKGAARENFHQEVTERFVLAGLDCD